MATEAANLFVKVTGDISDASKKLGQIGGMTQKTGGLMKGALSTALGFGAATIGLQAMGGAFGAVKGGVIDMNAELETSTLQFTTLMGDADKAQKHVESLFDFAAKTPFETGPIINASRTMETFGGAALNTNDNLKLFGDAAAAVSQPIDDVSFWMSRAYAAIQGGQPFGEARMRLMEMGILSPQVAAELEGLSAAGADTSEVWGTLTGSLGKFDGAMEKQSQTFDGMMSTFTDGVAMALAKGGKPLFDMFKKLLEGINNVMSSPAFQGAMAAAAEGLAAAFGMVADVFGKVWEIAQPLVDMAASLFGSFTGGAESVTTSFEGLGETMATWYQGVLEGIGGLVEQIVPMFAEMAGKAASWVIDALPGLLDNLATFLASMGSWLLDALPGIAAKLMEWAGAFIGWVLPMIPKVLSALGGFLGKMGGWLLGTALPKIVGMAGELGIGLVKGFLQFVIGPPGLLERIATFITGTLIPGIIKYGPQVLKAAGDIAGNFVKGFIDFMKDLPGKVASVIRKAFGSLRIDIGPFHISANGVTIDLPDIKLPGFATGSWDVPFTGPALIHKGEMIIPADLANRLRSGQGIGSGGSSVRGVAGGTAVIVNIGDFHGTEDNIRELSRRLGEVVRYNNLRKSAV